VTAEHATALDDGKDRATALFTWDEDAGASTSDLKFEQGDHIVVESESPGQGWMTGSIDDRVGIFPASHVEINEEPAPRELELGDSPVQRADDNCARLEIIMARLEEQLYAQAPIILSKTDCRNLLDRSSRRVDWALGALQLRLQYRHVEWDCCQAVSRCSGDIQRAGSMLREWRLLSLLAANMVLGSACVAILMLIAHADEETHLMWTCCYANALSLCVVNLYFFAFEQQSVLGTQPPRHARIALKRAEIDRPGPRTFQAVVSSLRVASLLASGDDDDDDEMDDDEDRLDNDMVRHASSNMEDIEITVSGPRVEMHTGDELICRIEMRWLESDTAICVAKDDPHALTLQPEFFQLPDARISNGRAVHIRTMDPAATVHDLIRRRQEPIQVPASAESSRHHCEWLRPLILRWIPAYACLSIYVSLTATEYGPYFSGGPYAIFLLFLLGVARVPFLGMYPDRAVLINVLRGEFDISMGYAHSMSPSRSIWFGSPAVWILMFALLLRGTMLTMPSTAFCAPDARPTIIVAGSSGSDVNDTVTDFGGISSKHISFLGAQVEEQDSQDVRNGEPPVFDDYAGEDLDAAVFGFTHGSSQQVRTTPPDSDTCDGMTPAWMDTLQMSGPCLHDDGTTDCSLPTAWEGPVPRKICLQTSPGESCGAFLPAVVQRCAHGHYRYKLPTPEATVINSGQLAVFHGSANITWDNVKVGTPSVLMGMVAGDIRVEYVSQAWTNGSPDEEEDESTAAVDADGKPADPQQLLMVRVRGSKFIAPAQTCPEANVSEAGRPSAQADVPVWPVTQNRRCDSAARIGRAVYGSTAEARAACERSDECQAISGPGACDGPGPWTLCRQADGQHSARPSCMHDKPAAAPPTLPSTCLREPFAANRSMPAAEPGERSSRTVVCAPRTAGRAYVMYTEEPAASRFDVGGKRAAGGMEGAQPPRLVSSVSVSPGSQAMEFSQHFVCVAYERGVGWVYDSGAVAHNAAGMLNVSSITFTPAASDVLVAAVEYGHTYHASYCLEDTPRTRVHRNSTGGAVPYDQWSDPAVIYPVVWFVLAVMLICDDPFFWGCNACRATGPHGLWCV